MVRASATPSTCPTATAHVVSVGPFDGVAPLRARPASRDYINQPHIIHRRFAAQLCRPCILGSHCFNGGGLPRCMDIIIGCGCNAIKMTYNDDTHRFCRPFLMTWHRGCVSSSIRSTQGPIRDHMVPRGALTLWSLESLNPQLLRLYRWVRTNPGPCGLGVPAPTYGTLLSG